MMAVSNPIPDVAQQEMLGALLALLPGFVTAEIVGALTVRERRAPLECIIQALLYTFLNHVLWSLASKTMNELSVYYLSYRWIESPQNNLIGLGITSVILGVLVTWIVNEGKLHELLSKPWIALTHRGSRPSVWYDTFYRLQNYVVVHLRDRRRVFGWPRTYSEVPGEGHLYLEDAWWLDGSPMTESTQLGILIDVKDVAFVEFVPPEPKKEQIHGRPEKPIDAEG